MSMSLFCSHPEGWGPASNLLVYSFTPCFVEIWILTVAVFGVAFGGYVLGNLAKAPVKFTYFPSQHIFCFWLKQSLFGLLIASVAGQLFLEARGLSPSWSSTPFLDIRLLAPLLSLLSLGIVFAVQWLEYARLRHPHDYTLLFWLCYLAAIAIKGYTLWAYHDARLRLYGPSNAFLTLFIVSCALALVTSLLELTAPTNKASYTNRQRTPETAMTDDEEDDLVPLANAHLFQRIFLTWLQPLLEKGYRRALMDQDIPPLRRKERAEVAQTEFDAAWQRFRAHHLSSSSSSASPPFLSCLWKTVIYLYYPDVLVSGAVRFLAQMFLLATPIILKWFLAFLHSYSTAHPDPLRKGFVLVFLLFALASLYTCLRQYHLVQVHTTAMRAKNAISSAVYRKALRLSLSGRKAQTLGTMVNLMTSDTGNILSFCVDMHSLWSLPLMLVFATVQLYMLLGWGVLPASLVLVVIIYVNTFVTARLRTYQKLAMVRRDERSHMLSELIAHMKSIKLYGWGPFFLNKVNRHRTDRELAALKETGLCDGTSFALFSLAIVFFSFTALAIFAATHDEQDLTYEVLFPALTLLNMINFPLNNIVFLWRDWTTVVVSFQRLQNFLLTDELQDDAVDWHPEAAAPGEPAVTIRRGHFCWDTPSTTAEPYTDQPDDRLSDGGPKKALNAIEYQAFHGELSCIVGRVGAGKSALLQAIVGDLYRLPGSEVTVVGQVAYAAQNPWVLNGSVKDNVLFGRPYDPDYYAKTVEACCLLEDFRELPDGDETIVGERGISLSGGQRARVDLARAVYSRADIYLLDDVLSAVDAHVGKRIVADVLGPRGLLRDKTRILATNAMYVLKYAGFVTMMEGGSIVERGTFSELFAKDNGAVASLVARMVDSQSSDTTPPTASSSIASSSFADTKQLTALEDSKAPTPAHLESTPKKALPLTKVQEERREIGAVSWSVYGKYIDAANRRYMLLFVTTLGFSFGLLHVASYVLKLWVESIQSHAQVKPSFSLGESAGVDAPRASAAGKNRAWWYLGVYLGLSVLASIFTVIKSYIQVVVCAIRASEVLHRQMATRLFRSPMSFFDTTPMGQILNRFTSDFNHVDVLLPRAFLHFFRSANRIVFTLLLLCIATPWILVLVSPLAVGYYALQQYFMPTLREAKRLSQISLSPIHQVFQETLRGSATIRAYRHQSRYTKQALAAVNDNSRIATVQFQLMRWLSERAEILGVSMVSGSAIVAVVSLAYGVPVDVGMVGLAMSYALNVFMPLTWMMMRATEVQTSAISVERVLEYTNLPSEAPEKTTDANLLAGAPQWPDQGAISFRNYSTRYRPELDPVLKGVDLDIRPGEKIGVVGRTGAGKSSLTLALFRLIEAAEGEIVIDGVDISKLGLLDLRTRLAIIPQDAALFSGTLRENLDPLEMHSDEELWYVLDQSRLRSFVEEELEGRLQARIEEKGSNLSPGQQQLVSLARAMLTKSKVLVLDEATAAVDLQTDALVQQVLRGPVFADRTIITVAHRLNTITDSDRIVVLDKGRVVEFDSPKALLAQPDGYFSGLVRDSGLAVDVE